MRCDAKSSLVELELEAASGVTKVVGRWNRYAVDLSHPFGVFGI